MKNENSIRYEYRTRIGKVILDWIIGEIIITLIFKCFIFVFYKIER